MKTFEQMQKEYAELIVWFWLNLQKRQNLLIKAPMEAVDFVKLVAKVAYQAWAKEIFYRRGNEELDLIKYQYAPEEVFDTVPQWIEDGYVHELKNNCAQLSLYMQDPELLKEVDSKKVSRLMQAQARSKHEYRKLISENWTNWTIAEQIIFINQEILKKIYKNSEIRFSALWESTKKIRSEPGKITSKTSITMPNISTHSSLGLSIIKEKILI